MLKITFSTAVHFRNVVVHGVVLVVREVAAVAFTVTFNTVERQKLVGSAVL